jgi:serine/threonine protein kinase/tetratricopeptide (TPR) repeat protein
MDNQQHDRLSELFERAIELSPDTRAHFIDVCCDDPAIRSELRSLLAAHERAPNLLERIADDVLPATLDAVAEDDAVGGPTVRRAQPLASTAERPNGAAMRLPTGTRLGSYEIQGRIAAGGIGVVYRAFDTRLQRPVAIKTLGSSVADAHESILREARAASALNHPHICTIYEVGGHDGIPFIAMEYVEGRPLRDVIPSNGLPTELVVRYGCQVAEAVEHAHRHGIIHRDLKSANVMISPESQAKVLDFGLASRIPAADMETLTRSRVVEATSEPLAGTLAYLAPELLRGGVADKRSDVWALGVLLYEMAAGRLPFQGATPFELTAAILGESLPPLPPRISMPLRAVIGRCLARDPAQRYQHAGEARVALETLQLGSDSAVALPGESNVVVAPVRRRRGALVVAGVIVLALVTVAGLMFFNVRHTLPLTDRDTLLVADFVNTTGDSVFDGALKQALSISLEQSPFLSLVSREEVRDTLRLMTRSPDDRVVGDVAREACQRFGAKAVIEGSIAPLGSHYAIGLDAVECQSGKTVASEQAEAARREQVLTVLSTSASGLRRKLGESLPTIQRFDTPIPQATTPSLEALKAFSAGDDVRTRRGELDAVPFYKRAIELDPDFATAYGRLSAIYFNVGETAEMRRNTEEAYARRDRVSERERFYIDGRHCVIVRTDPECYATVHELWKRTYPRDPMPYANLAAHYNFRGMPDKALENGVEAMRLKPAHPIVTVNLAEAYLGLGRSTDARRTLDQTIARHVEHFSLYLILFRVAFFDRDERTMATARQWARGRPEESLFVEQESDAAAFDGHIRRARELRQEAERLAAPHLNETVLSIRARGAVCDAADGDFDRARRIVHRMTAEPAPGSELQLLATAALLSRDYQQVDALFEQIERPDLSGQQGAVDPIVRVFRDIEKGDHAAIDRLPPASAWDLAPRQSFRPVYVRGLIYLHSGDGAKAASEFQRILDHRGTMPTSPLYPLAYVQQARAYTLGGDQTKARKAYQDFFALWKDADPDIPILREAKTEYARLSASQATGR